VATTAGPFSLYGTRLVEACVANRTHYCDINGETPWIRGLIDRHHAQAAADGTRIVVCCGYDSIPSDYGAWLVSRHVREVLHSDCVSVLGYFRMDGGGGINGGTMAAVFNLAETGQLEMTRDPFLLNPDPASHSQAELLHNADPAGVRYDTVVQAWVTPFLMGSINTRVVRRTQALLGQRFDYQEYARFDSSSVARMASLGANVFASVLGSRFARRIMNPLLPKPGQGPSEKAMNEGSVECEFIGTATSGVRVQAVLKAQGDAGNRFTVKCLCESAFVLALSAEAHSGPKPGTGGILTPVTGLGDELATRLRAVGISFQIV
jgi:short subunit dehydrogenase-like uncharacterized protein